MALNKKAQKRIAEILKELNQLLDEAKAKYERVQNNPLLKKVYETPDAFMLIRTGDEYVPLDTLRGEIIKWQTYIAQLTAETIQPQVLKMWGINKLLK
jgi:hypothetical protein